MVFLKKVQNSSGELVYLVRLKNAGRDILALTMYCWINSKRSLFEQAMKADYIDVAKYGKILHSGWGKNPPDRNSRSCEETILH